MEKEALGLYMNIMAIGSCYDGRVASTEDLSLLECYATNKTGSVVWSGSMDVDKERRTSSANF